MYFLVIFSIIIAATIIHIVSEFKKKAELTGESKLSITAKNILPASKTCKICSLITFTGMIMTGLVLIFENSYQDMNLFQINSSQWKTIHLVFMIMFFSIFGLHIYIHWTWIKNVFKGKHKAVF